MPEDFIALRVAYWWVCPQCQTENFEKSVPVEMTREELEEACLDAGVDPEDYAGGFCKAPNLCECAKCGMQVATTDDGSPHPFMTEDIGPEDPL